MLPLWLQAARGWLSTDHSSELLRLSVQLKQNLGETGSLTFAHPGGHFGEKLGPGLNHPKLCSRPGSFLHDTQHETGERLLFTDPEPFLPARQPATQHALTQVVCLKAVCHRPRAGVTAAV